MQEVTRLLWCELVLQLNTGEVMKVDTGVKILGTSENQAHAL